MSPSGVQHSYTLRAHRSGVQEENSVSVLPHPSQAPRFLQSAPEPRLPQSKPTHTHTPKFLKPHAHHDCPIRTRTTTPSTHTRGHYNCFNQHTHLETHLSSKFLSTRRSLKKKYTNHFHSTAYNIIKHFQYKFALHNIKRLTQHTLQTLGNKHSSLAITSRHRSTIFKRLRFNHTLLLHKLNYAIKTCAVQTKQYSYKTFCSSVYPQTHTA